MRHTHFRQNRSVVLIACCIDLCLLGLVIFWEPTVDRLRIFVLPLLLLIVLAFFHYAIRSVSAALTSQRSRLSALGIGLFHTAILGSSCLIWFSAANIWWDFEPHAAEFAAVAALVNQNQVRLPPDYASDIPVPAPYGGLTRDGTMFVDGSPPVFAITFFRYRDLIGYIAIAYLPDDDLSIACDATAAGTSMQLQPHWYWVTCKDD